ncbi:UvrD/Rep helicase family protein [Enhygromyxa salina]|uniref:DNA 3'-5' helicase II n=1 Tax=Enhygromyxa salina TaxID=215803 RepID=A0A0C2CXC9_9BACT|nr:ATP-binding domain-containing protein [Enhygromyxa salina]KIG14265.1 UvrD/Rep helicase family protein [Enhygromyxa salina]
MNRDLTASERERCAAIEQQCAAIWDRHPAARCYAYLRVRTRGSERTLILGGESIVAGPLVLLDWEQAPLAEVFLAHEVGDEYELELDAERSVEGVVLERAILRTQAPAQLVEIDDGQHCLTRVGVNWTASPTRLLPAMPLREPAARAHTHAAIVLELDADQRRGVELDPARSLLILGEAGFGKTTVALHRLAHLRTCAHAAGRPFTALVVVPTRGLARLVTALLERLGVEDVEVREFSDWAAIQGRRVFGDLPRKDSSDAPPAIARFKRHPALRAVLPEIVRGTAAMREVEAGYRDDETVRTGEQLLHLFGDRALLEQVAAASHGQLGPRTLAQVLAHTKVQFSPTSERALAHVDADRLRTVDGRAIDEGTPLHDAQSIDPEDFAVLFELLYLRTGASLGPKAALARYHHIVLDEAQEFAPIELALVGRALAPGGSITIAGDEHQQVDEGVVFPGWSALLTELGVSERCDQLVLQASYRCPPVIEAFARTLFASLPTGELRRDDPALSVSPCAHELELVSVLIHALLELRLHDRQASVAVVCRHASSGRRMHALLSKAMSCRLVLDGDFRFGPGISVTCIDEIKGLEFDYVILPDASAVSYPDTPEARRALYVGVTRAVARLWLLWSGRPSPLILPPP